MSVYVVMLRERVTDQAQMETYTRLAPLAREVHNMNRLAFYGVLDVLEGVRVAGIATRTPSFDGGASSSSAGQHRPDLAR